MKYIAFPFCIFLDFSSLDAWASLAFSKNFAIRDGELTPSRQKKEQVSLLCPRFFVTLALPKLPALGNEKKN